MMRYRESEADKSDMRCLCGVCGAFLCVFFFSSDGGVGGRRDDNVREREGTKLNGKHTLVSAARVSWCDDGLLCV